MKKKPFVIVGVIVTMLAGILNGQSIVEIRAAASTAVAGWQQMATPGGNPLWVAPDTRLTGADIARAEARMVNGEPAVAIVLTDEGAKKMEALSREQLNQQVALMLDGQVIWAPIVRSALGKEGVLSGGPGGLTKEQIDRLLTSLKR